MSIISEEVALANFKLLEDNDFKLENVINDQENLSITAYGSEFKSTNVLEELLGHHPRWKVMKSRLENGVEFPLEALSESTRKKDLEGALRRCNHKSALVHEVFLADAF